MEVIPLNSGTGHSIRYSMQDSRFHFFKTCSPGIPVQSSLVLVDSWARGGELSEFQMKHHHIENEEW